MSSKQPQRPRFRNWLLAVVFKWFYLEGYENWKRNAEDFYKYYFFESTFPINTPLVWTKDVISDSIKTTMDTYKQFVVTFVGALFTGSVSLVVIAQGSSVNLELLKWLWKIIIVLIIFSYARMKFKSDIKDAMLTVVLEHNCTTLCKDRHFPH